MSTAADGAGSRPQNVARQGSVVAAMTLISRLSGFARDMGISWVLGAGVLADAFFVAFRIPNFFRRLFAEGAFQQAFVPVLARYRREPAEVYRAFIATVLGNLLLVLTLVVLFGVVFSGVLTTVFAPGYRADPERFELVAAMTRITFPYLGFISLTALAAALLNSHGRYAVPAVTPVLLNLSLIGALLLGVYAAINPVIALAWGVFVAGALQFAFQLPFLGRLGLIVMPRPGADHPGARAVGRLLLPAVVASSASQINALIDTMVASTLIAGSISWIYYADRLLELPVGLVAVALGTVLLPNLSRLAAADNEAGFAGTLDWGLRMALLFGLPAAVALHVLALPLVATIFAHGAMSALDARMAALALQAFAVGLLPIILVKVLAPAFFARQDTKTPLRIALVAILTNIALNLATFRWFGHVGLAFATSVAACVNAGLLFRAVTQRGYRPGASVQRTGLRVGASVLVMIAALLLVLPPSAQWLSFDPLARVAWLALGVTLGGGVFALALFGLGERPRDLRHRI
ncbi:MAG: murein biosynthesis integral membrane protein MurJ [Pseudomonadales bacterium]